METLIENTNKLTDEQETELAGYYDTLALFFGGDELEPIREYCGGCNNIQYYKALKNLDNKLTWFRKKGKAPYMVLVKTKSGRLFAKEVKE